MLKRMGAQLPCQAHCSAQQPQPLRTDRLPSKDSQGYVATVFLVTEPHDKQTSLKNQR